MLAFSRPFFQQGLINRKAALTSAYSQFVFMQGGADADQIERMRTHLVALCTGWDVAQVRSIIEETLHDIVDPLVYREAAELIAEHKEAGHDVIIVSASGKEIVDPIAAMLGVTNVLSTRMVIANGRYTGGIEFYCYGENKARAIVNLAESLNYDLGRCHAYSDSATDLPMLETVGHPTAVNPDRALRKIAVQRGWPIMTFSEQVSLRNRISAPSPTVVAVAIGLSIVATGLTWYGIHRRRISREKSHPGK